MTDIEKILAADRRARAKRWLAFFGSELITAVLLFPAFAVLFILAKGGLL